MGRRGIGSRELGQRERRIRAGIAAQLVELRHERGVTQRQLAMAAGIDHGHLSRIERGLAVASLECLVALAANLGADLSVRLFPTATSTIRDRLQAPMVEAVVRLLGSQWRASVEVPVPEARGVIDLVLRRAEPATALACEAHSQLRSLDLVLRRLTEKALALKRSTDDDSAVSGVLLLRSTESTQRIVRLHEATLGSVFSGRIEAALEALASGTAWPGPTLLWIRVESGRAEVLRQPPRRIRLGR